MYIPTAYNMEQRAEMLAFIDKWNFADLVSVNNGRITSNKLPLLVDIEQGVLYGHLGHANQQVHELESAEDLLVIFSGLHNYISPQWYASEGMVPTWNFETVQVRGRAQLVDSETLLQILNKLTQKHEAISDNPWAITNLLPTSLEKMLKLIVGFKIEIEQIEGKQKLSQIRSVADRQSVINALEKQNDQITQAMAKKMRSQIE